eukprot:539086-Prymnesium_polylepis.1
MLQLRSRGLSIQYSASHPAQSQCLSRTQPAHAVSKALSALRKSTYTTGERPFSTQVEGWPLSIRVTRNS